MRIQLRNNLANAVERNDGMSIIVNENRGDDNRNGINRKDNIDET